MLELSVSIEIETDATGQIPSFVKDKVWETEAKRHFKRGGEITLNYIQWKQGTKENWPVKPSCSQYGNVGLQRQNKTIMTRG